MEMVAMLLSRVVTAKVSAACDDWSNPGTGPPHKYSLPSMWRASPHPALRYIGLLSTPPPSRAISKYVAFHISLCSMLIWSWTAASGSAVGKAMALISVDEISGWKWYELRLTLVLGELVSSSKGTPFQGLSMG